MVYAGSIEGETVSMGVSGRLEHKAGDRNLIMWDEETNSLWSQIRGEGLSGANAGKRLDMLPAVFVGLGTWSRMHPDSKVLDLSTVRNKPWYYTSEDLARGTVRANRSSYTLIVGLRTADEQIAVALPALHARPVIPVELGGEQLLTVWHADESAALVYRVPAGLQGAEFSCTDGTLEAGTRSWDTLTGTALGDGDDLARFPYLPSYQKVWLDYYPDSRVIEAR